MNEVVATTEDPAELNIFEVCITDLLKLLTKDGFYNIGSKYGTVKNVEVHSRNDENQAYILFEDENSVCNIISNKTDLPLFLSVKKSDRHILDNNSKSIENDVEKCEVNPSPDEIVEQDSLIGQPVYFGHAVPSINLVKNSKQLKLKKNNKTCYHLNNDDLFGKPLDVNVEYMNKPNFVLHKIDFDCKFKNGDCGDIVVEKKLGHSIFVGWTVTVGGVSVLDILKQFSSSIESSDILSIQDLQLGMFVGAFDNVTKLYFRGYISLLAGNSANVALSDIGRVVNTTDIRVLPESFTQIPAYSFKGYTKGKFVQQFKEGKSYAFTVMKESGGSTFLSLKSDSATKVKVQIKHWEPTVEELGVPAVHFKNGCLVELLKLKTMDSLIIRSKERRDVENLFFSWDSIAQYCYDNREPLKRDPFYGEIIGYKMASSKNYVRGRIHKYLGDDVYSVKQMNDPVKENVKLSAMIGLNYEQKCIPLSFLNVGLHKTYPFPIQFEAKEFIDLMKGVILSLTYDKSNPQGWKTVGLTIKILEECFNSILYGLVEPLWLKSSSDDFVEEFGNYCTYDHLLTIELENNSVETMTFVTMFDGIIYMRDNYFGKSFLVLSEMIKEYCSIDTNWYLPHSGEVCLGQFKDGNWYRIVCDIVKPGQLIQAYLIDLGGVAFLNTSQCRKFPRELLFEPTHAYPCYLDFTGVDNVKINAENLNRLLGFENKENIDLTIVKKVDQNNSCMIKCPFFEDILK